MQFNIFQGSNGLQWEVSSKEGKHIFLKNYYIDNRLSLFMYIIIKGVKIGSNILFEIYGQFRNNRTNSLSPFAIRYSLSLSLSLIHSLSLSPTHTHTYILIENGGGFNGCYYYCYYYYYYYYIYIKIFSSKFLLN